MCLLEHQTPVLTLAGQKRRIGRGSTGTEDQEIGATCLLVSTLCGVRVMSLWNDVACILAPCHPRPGCSHRMSRLCIMVTSNAKRTIFIQRKLIAHAEKLRLHELGIAFSRRLCPTSMPRLLSPTQSAPPI